MLEEEKGLLKLENQEPFGHNSVSGFELLYHIRILSLFDSLHI